MTKRFIALASAIALGLVALAPVSASHEGNTDSRLQIVGNESICDLTKSNTWDQSFKQDGAPKFRNVTFGSADRGSHFEPHTGPGVPGVSWVLPMGVTGTMNIFGGSQWSGPCGPEGYNYEQDAVQYAQSQFNGRYEDMSDGHSGLVILVGGADNDQCILIDTTSSGEAISSERSVLTDLILNDQREHMDPGSVLCPSLSATDAVGYAAPAIN